LADNRMFSTRTRNLVDLLRRRAEEPSQAPAYTFLNSNLEVSDQVSYGELHRRAMWIAGELQRAGKAGERALLLYPPGISFIESFFGSLYAGWIAVPAYLPTGSHNSSRVESIVRDAKPKIVLTSSAMLAQVKLWLGGFSRIKVLATDTCRTATDAAWRPPRLSGDEIALLQYTSGSISTPKGVMVSHKTFYTMKRQFGSPSSSLLIR